MNKHYDHLLQKLNVVKLELKGRNDTTLNLCIEYIKEAIFDAGRLNSDLELYESSQYDDDADCWCE